MQRNPCIRDLGDASHSHRASCRSTGLKPVPVSCDTEARIVAMGQEQLVSGHCRMSAGPHHQRHCSFRGQVGHLAPSEFYREGRGRKEPGAGETAAGGDLCRIHGRFSSWLGHWTSGPENYVADFSGTGWDENKLA